MTSYRICTNCVMDTSVSDIEFDEAGVCHYCRAASARLASEQFDTEAHQGLLEAVISDVKRQGRGKPYDCIIGVSGGADSSYVAYLVKHTFGLRPLAVHFDNGWNSDLAVENIERLLKRLEIDLDTHVVDWDEFRDLQLSFLKASVANCEIPTDHAILALLYRTAARHGLKYVLHGGNLSTESIMPSVWMEDPVDLRFLRAIHRTFGTRRLKTFPTMGYTRLAYYTLVRGIRYVGVLNYVQYDKAEKMRFLEREFGWRPYQAKHFESIYTRWFQGFLLPRKFAMDKRRPHLASLIVSGQMTRAEALRELEGDPYQAQLAEEDTRYIRRKFGLSEQEFDAIMTTPPKSLRDYPNSAWIRARLGTLVRRAKARATRRPYQASAS
jgi:N-acetyl sugar amidotransferase